MKDFTEELQKIFSNTGDSELKRYSYRNNKISLEAELFDGDILNIEFETEILYCRNIERTPFTIGYFECVKLSDIVKVENNHYTFSGGFVEIMKAQRNKLNLVFGLSIKENTHLITFSNSTVNLAFVVNEKNDFKCEIT